MTALAITGCSDIDGDPFAFLAPGPPGQERPEIPAGELTPGAAVHAMAPEDPLVGLPPFQPLPGGMKGTLGLNLEIYLSNNSESTEERVARLERVIVAMNRDMQAMAPVLQKPDAPPPAPPPATITMQPILEAPENLLNGDMQAPPATPPIVTPPPPAAQDETIVAVEEVTTTTTTTPAPAASGAPAGTGMRVGEHADKMRLVVDVSADTPYSIDLDNAEHIMIVELPQAGWNGPGAMNLDIGLVKSYKVEQANGGSMIIVQLTGATSVISQSKLPAVSGTGRRIVIDLKR